ENVNRPMETEIPQLPSSTDEDESSLNAEDVRARILYRIESMDNEIERLEGEAAYAVASGNLGRKMACDQAIVNQQLERIKLNTVLGLIDAQPERAQSIYQRLDRQGFLKAAKASQNGNFQSLRYVGRNARGIPMYEGDTHKPSSEACLRLIA